jgi:hypothetical protein
MSITNVLESESIELGELSQSETVTRWTSLEGRASPDFRPPS